MNRNYRKNPPNAWDLSKKRGRGGGPRPPGLRGKEIGLFYKNLNMSKGKQNKKEMVIHFGMPPSVENRVSKNLDTIRKFARDLNISVGPMKVPLIKQEKVEDVDTEGPRKSTTSDSHCDESTTKDLPSPNLDMSIDGTETECLVYDPLPSTSSMPDFIEVKKEYIGYQGEKMVSMRGGGDYKYGYEDIITGTFEEKLDDSLAKGQTNKIPDAEKDRISNRLFHEYFEMKDTKTYKKMLDFREKLPAYKKKDEILYAINSNQVIVISGETGCGKSTQVPQLILDEAIKNKDGASVNIVVTQPRRIAASSLAQRVAAERAEELGYSVGYTVRLEKIDAREHGSIMFYTTGVLLAELEVNQSLSNYSHIILDEVHERDCQVDLSMCMLRKVLRKRKDLKLILMSATLDAEKLSEYFDNCCMLHIEGLAYPVLDLYLEEVLMITNFVLPPARSKPNQPKWKKHVKKHRDNEQAKSEKEMLYAIEIDRHLKEMMKDRPELKRIRDTLLDLRIEDLNTDLIVELLKNICRGPPGAILVFVPGIGDITKIVKTMENSECFPPSLYEIYPLHSKLPSLQQHKIFERPRGNIRKIIVATNIAETSITIDDVVYVIDSGKIKIKGLNIEENVSTLKTEWVSQANLRQRRGRAGRCQPGVCYHLISSYRAEKLDERILPELQRSDLLEPVLTVKKLRLGKAIDAFNDVPSPPARSTINWAVKHLQQCGALNEWETLTPLGWHLARLPVHPSAGKLLLLGSLFGCLDRAASVAAVWGFKDPFLLVIGKEKETDAAKRELAMGEPSDHVAISEAIIAWESTPYNKRRHFAYENYLSEFTLELLSEMKGQFGDSLRQMGFLPNGDVKSGWENRNANNLSLFKALVAASLYPKIATARWTKGKPRQGREARVKTYLPIERRKVSIHPSSVLSPGYGPGSDRIRICNEPGAQWAVYWLKQRSTDLFLIEITLVHTLPLLFFGELSLIVPDTDDDTEDSFCFVHLDEVKLRCKNRTMNILFELRSYLDKVLAAKINNVDDGTIHSDFEECVLIAVIELITAEDERIELFDDEDSSSDISEVGSGNPHHSKSYKSQHSHHR